MAVIRKLAKNDNTASCKPHCFHLLYNCMAGDRLGFMIYGSVLPMATDMSLTSNAEARNGDQVRSLLERK